MIAVSDTPGTPVTPQPSPLLLGGELRSTGATIDVVDAFSGALVGRAALAGPTEVETAIAGAARARPAMEAMPSFERRAVLVRLGEGLARESEALARLLTSEVGKTIREARSEVARAIETIGLSAEEATRPQDELLRLDGTARGRGMRALVARVPVGACSFITPFNFPLNLAVHKIGPAIAAGCPFVLKPDPRTPLATLELGRILAGCGLPAGAASILPIVDEAARDALVVDERLSVLSFTGSPAVGWALKARAGRKRVVLELGGNAACIVDEGADVEHAAERIAWGAFVVAGQSCISVQRILAHRTIAAQLRDRLVARARALVMGDPRQEQTDLGPLIREREAVRVESWINEAVCGGARVLTGSARRGAFIEPTLLEGVPPDARVSCQEVFGPVAAFDTFDSFDEALTRVDESPFGLQAGVFTPRLDRALLAWERLHVGGVIVNDVPTTRLDGMP